MEERIQLEDSMTTIIIKLSDENLGAAICLMEVVKNARQIDPDSAMGEYGSLLLLDTFGIYGSNIHVLFTDICDKDVVKFIAVLRACQLGYISRDILKSAASRKDYSDQDLIPVDDLYNKVKERLPNFNSKKTNNEKDI